MATYYQYSSGTVATAMLPFDDHDDSRFTQNPFGAAGTEPYDTAQLRGNHQRQQ